MTQIGPYRLSQLLGRGGMGEVWLGHDPTGLAVAVKLMTAEGVRDPWFQAAFRREVRAMAGLDHPAVVRILDQGEVGAAPGTTGGTPYLAMELADGGTLAGDCGRVGWAEAQRVLLGLLDGLGHAHARGVLHRDLKPANVLLQGARRQVKLTDFGLAHALDHDDHLLEDGVVVGTAAYMAPEQIAGDWRDFGPQTDLYATACLAWALLTGAPPFGYEPQRATVGQVELEPPALAPTCRLPPGVEGWLRWLLQKDPARRPQCAADAAAALVDLRRRGRAPFRPDWRQADGSEDRPRGAVGLGLFGLRSLTVVDREAERARLWAALGLVQAGATRAFVLGGGVGAGKSRLARWLQERALEVGAATTLAALEPEMLVRRALRVEGLDRDALRARADLWVRRHGQDDPDLVRSIVELLHPAPRSEVGIALAPGAVRFGSPAERFEVVARVLDVLAAERPVVIWFDDAHLHPEALDFAAHLLARRERRDAAVLVVLTVRDDLVVDLPLPREALRRLEALPDVERVDVGPLPPSHRQLLVKQLLGLSAELSRQVVRQTEGNPLFAVHLVSDWVQRGALETSPRGLVLRAGVKVDLPQDLLALWEGAVSRVIAGRSEAEVLGIQLAAVLGAEVDGDEWHAACVPLGFAAPWRLAEDLVDRRLVTSPRGPREGFSFAHALFRERLILRAGPRVAALHRAAAAMLERRRGPGVSERRGRHLMAGGAWEPALDALLAGARERVLAGQQRRAVELVELREEALRRGGRGPMDEAWGEGKVVAAWVAEWRGDLESAARLAQEVADAGQKYGWLRTRADALRGLGRVVRKQGRPLVALSLLRTGERLAVEAADPWLVETIRQQVGFVLLHLGELPEAEAVLLAARDRLRELGDLDYAATCSQTLFDVARQLGRLEDARGHLRDAREGYEAAGSRYAVAGCILGEGELLRSLGRTDDAEERCALAAARYVDLGADAVVVAIINLGLARVDGGRWQGALDVLAEARVHCQRQGKRGYLAVVELALAACQARLGGACEPHLASAEQLLHQTGLVELDVARLAGLLARDGPVELRARAGRLAAEQYEALGRTPESQLPAP